MNYIEAARQAQIEREKGISEAKRIFAGYDRRRVKDLLVHSIGEWILANPTEREFFLNGPGVYLSARVAKELNEPEQRAAWKELVGKYIHDLEFPEHFLELMWWFVGRGYLLPIFYSNYRDHNRWDHGVDTRVERYRITPAGMQFFASGGDTLLRPGFLERLKVRCPALPDEVIAHFENACDCSEASVPRPAVIMLGLAYEAAIEWVGVALANKGRFPLAKFEGDKAAARIATVRGVVDVVTQAKDERGRIRRALDFADTIRERRNDGGHTKPAWPFDDRAEVDDLLIQAGSHMPALCLMHAKA